VTWERLNGFASSNIVSETIQVDGRGVTNSVLVQVERPYRWMAEIPQDGSSTLPATNITVNGLLRWSSSPTVAQPVLYGYDPLARVIAITNSLGFAARTEYDHLGQVTNTVDFSGVSRSYEYYGNGSFGAGKVKVETIDGKTSRYAYTARGELHRVWGHVPMSLS
jgi:YD repeat-containing protein